MKPRFGTTRHATPQTKPRYSKTGIKEILSRHGLVATFMARWSPDYPGCSGHLHQSLWNLEGDTNLFADESDPLGMSQIMKHYIAGQIATMPHMMALICPTINSYKRTVPGAWAPTNASWGIENRTASLRAISSTSPESTRHRISTGRRPTPIPTSRWRPALPLGYTA